MKLLFVPAVAAVFLVKGLMLGMAVGVASGGLAACACRRARRRQAETRDTATTETP